jgi:S1-C subfamily serine protease
MLTVVTTPRECLSIPNGLDCDTIIENLSPTTVNGTGSGTIIRHTHDHTYVITAHHVCSVNAPPVITINTPIGPVIISVEHRSDIVVMDYNGHSHPVRYFAGDRSSDLCLLQSPGQWGRSAPIASRQPEYGELVTNTAAPRGVFSPGMVLALTGRYSGSDAGGRYFYTIPAVPGSSGSGIFNRYGELVGVIHSAFRDFQFAAIASGLRDVRVIMEQLDNINNSSMPTMTR